jgi:hypothetical protein
MQPRWYGIFIERAEVQGATMQGQRRRVIKASSVAQACEPDMPITPKSNLEAASQKL